MNTTIKSACHDQPYIVYNAFKYKLYNNKILKSLVVNNDFNIHGDKVIHHFPGGPGVYHHKIISMTKFLNTLNNSTFQPGVKIYNVTVPPPKNTTFPLIGLSVSVNYFDTLQFFLPCNYLHFQKIYIITQEDQIQTIEFCKMFDNVIVLFHDFKNNNKHFDKYGGLNYAQEIAYRDYPESWYLIIDCDIILPNNLIDILNIDHLNPDCIYGTTRYICQSASNILNKHKYTCGNEYKTFPVIGFFQLYKKKVFHRANMNHGAFFGDIYIVSDNFDVSCCLEDLLCIHLGTISKNWGGKVVSFINDINLECKQIYYKYDRRIHNKYYNKEGKIVKYGTIIDKQTDLWTISHQMRFDIYDFFQNNPGFKIAEIGSHKGYTTSFLSTIFSIVYSIDNNIEFTMINKNLNKNARNIEYVMLDIYNNSWEKIPDDIDVSFIDAVHSYLGCKSDTMNSIKRFKTLKYIIFDDYGTWPGVKQCVDELIQNKILKFEKFIGTTDVPSPTGIINNVNEGIICSVVVNKQNVNKQNVNKQKNKMRMHFF
jgi:hypothetical protein